MKKSLLAIVLLFLFTSLVRADDRPNIVLFIADDVSVDDVACYGHPTIQTPHIDQLARDGIRFTEAYLTISSCSPSRCSLITGRYPHNTGAPELHSALPPEQVRFPKLLKELGYYTVLSGKNHMGNVKDAFTKISGGKGPGREEDWVQILEERPQEQPFFMWFASTDAHAPFVINDKAPVYDSSDVVIPPYMYDAPGIRKQLAAYYHEVSRYDFYIGEVVKELKKQNVLENTVIIVMADNGRPFTRAKTRVYDSGIKTPFVVHFPKVIRQGAVSESFVSSIDVAATVLDLAGVEKDSRVQGVSFVPVLKNSCATVRDVVFAEHNWHVNQAHERMVRMGDYLYIKNSFPNRRLWCVEASYPELMTAFEAGELNVHQRNVFRNPCPAEELFQVRCDPDQLQNLAGHSEYEQVLGSMREQLAKWTEQTGDSVPKNPSPDRGTPEANGQRSPHREFPGKSAGAETINHPGPVRVQ